MFSSFGSLTVVLKEGVDFLQKNSNFNGTFLKISLLNETSDLITSFSTELYLDSSDIYHLGNSSFVFGNARSNYALKISAHALLRDRLFNKSSNTDSKEVALVHIPLLRLAEGIEVCQWY